MRLNNNPIIIIVIITLCILVKVYIFVPIFDFKKEESLHFGSRRTKKKFHSENFPDTITTTHLNKSNNEKNLKKLSKQPKATKKPKQTKKPKETKKPKSTKVPTLSPLNTFPPSISKVMDEEIFVIPDAGRYMQLGQFYDARKSSVIPGRLWNMNDDFIAKYKVTKTASSEKLEVSTENNFSSRLGLLNVGIEGKFELIKKVLSNELEGSFQYLKEKKQTSNCLKYAMNYSVRKKSETLDIYNKEMLSKVNSHIFMKRNFSEGIDYNLATHFVSSVTWGANIVVSFEHSYKDSLERNRVELGLKSLLNLNKYGINTDVSNDFKNEVNQKLVNENTRVVMFGDIININRKIPTTPGEAIIFIEDLAEKSDEIVGEGVPMEITLTPLSWIQKSVKVNKSLPNNVVENIVKVFESLEESESQIIELLKLPFDGYTSWKFDAEKFYNDFKDYQRSLLFNISNIASAILSEEENIEALHDVFSKYWAPTNEFSLLSVISECEDRRGDIKTLLSLTAQFESADISFAKHLGDFNSPTFDLRYEVVYGLILVGTKDVYRDRENVPLIHDMIDLAYAHKCEGTRGESCRHPDGSVVEDSEIKHCEKINGESKCSKFEKMVAIHFDSFCSDFCSDEFCNRYFKNEISCENQENDNDNNPFSESWCSCPKTQILKFIDNQNAKVVKNVIDKIPLAPTVKIDIIEQKIQLSITNIEQRTDSIKIILKQVDSNGIEGDTKERKIHKYVKDSKSLQVVENNFLIAGKEYDIFVTGLNAVGEGPAFIRKKLKVGD